MTTEERLKHIEVNQTLLDQRISDLELKELEGQISDAENKLAMLNKSKKRILGKLTQGRERC